MPASIGVNLRVTGHCSQGGRKYMEDLFSVAYQQTEDGRDLEYAFFGIYDGHGGSEAAAYAKEHLMDCIVKQKQFWSDDDEDVLKAIRSGYMLTHLNMWKEIEKWPKTLTGLPSTAGTTASVAFIRRGKIYIGHVGDSAIVLGYQKEGSDEWIAKPLTSDHKPESKAETERIQKCGGKVVAKAGVPRVVWNRPRVGHKGPIKKNTPMDEIPFLAVARSLGDLWSYNQSNDEFIVSPDPDVGVLIVEPSKFRCLIFGTDGLWNMLTAETAVKLVQATEKHNENALVGGNGQPRDWLNPSKSLVDHALERWSNTRMRADNTSVVTLMLDPPGPPRTTVLRCKTVANKPAPVNPLQPQTKSQVPSETDRQVPENGLTILTRYSNVDKPVPSPDTSSKTLPPCTSIDARLSIVPTEVKTEEESVITNYGNPAESYFMSRLLGRSGTINTLSDVYDEIVNGHTCIKVERSPSPPPRVLERRSLLKPDVLLQVEMPPTEDGGIQINEVSSSSLPEASSKAKPKKSKEPKVVTPNSRVLRSHDAADTRRPQTRLSVRTGRSKENRRDTEPHSTTALRRALRTRNACKRAPDTPAPDACRLRKRIAK